MNHVSIYRKRRLAREKYMLRTQTPTAQAIERVLNDMRVFVCHSGFLRISRVAKCGYMGAWTFRVDCAECKRELAGSQYTTKEIVSAHKHGRVVVSSESSGNHLLVEHQRKECV